MQAVWIGHHTLRRFARAIPIRRLRHYKPRPVRLSASNVSSRTPASPPTISIVTPSFNQATFLERTIQSVVRQNYPRLEYIVQDGGSLDGSVDIIQRYSDVLSHWESAPDSGQADAINRAFGRTTGDIMAWLNSDDLLLDGAINLAAQFFSEHPEVDVIYGQRILIDEDDREIGRWILPPHDDATLVWFDYVPQETLFWRRRIWERVGGALDPSFQFALDWDLLLRFQEAGARFARLPNFLGAFRVHTAQKTQSWSDTVGRAETRRLRERYLGYAPRTEAIVLRAAPYLARHLIHHLLYRLRVFRY